MIAFLLYFIVTFSCFTVFFKEELRNRLFWLAYFGKVLLASTYFLLYKFYFLQGDIFTYDSILDSLDQYAFEEPFAYFKFVFFGFRNQVIENISGLDYSNIPFVRFNAVFHLLSNGNMAVCGLYYATFIFGSSWFVYRIIQKKSVILSQAYLMTFLLIPSIVFWSSGFAKEGLLLILLQVLFLNQYNFVPKNTKNILFSILIWLFILRLRHFIAIVYGFQFLFWLIIEKEWLKDRRKLIFACIYVLFGVFGLILIAEHEFSLSFPQIIYHEYCKFSKSTDLQHFILLPLDGSWWSFLKSIPLAFYKGLIYPFPEFNSSLFFNVLGFENVTLLFLVFVSLIFKRKEIGLKNISIVFYMISFVTLLPMLAPEIGTLARYKLVYTPILWMWVIYTFLNWKQNKLLFRQ